MRAKLLLKKFKFEIWLKNIEEFKLFIVNANFTMGPCQALHKTRIHCEQETEHGQKDTWNA